MNDRYLYRAKRKNWIELPKDKWLVEGYYAYMKPYHYIMPKGNYDSWIEIDEKTLCACTGLNDKNGKLIFENDIVKFDVYEYEKLVSSTVSEIKWCEELCSLSVVVNKQGIRGTLGHFLDLNKEVEVIGSAIDNPELLEK